MMESNSERREKSREVSDTGEGGIFCPPLPPERSVTLEEEAKKAVLWEAYRARKTRDGAPVPEDHAQSRPVIMGTAAFNL